MKQLEKNLIELYRSLLNKEFIARQVSDAAHPDYRLSAMNLVRYITLRNQDLRNVHDHLSEIGVSSLRTCESYVMHNVISVLKIIKRLNGQDWEPADVETIGYKGSKKLLRKHSRQLFNTKKTDRLTKIMVTLPEEAAKDPMMIRDMLTAGMEIARINLSHGDESEWVSMVDHVRTQAELLDKQCMIYMDLSGPKIRTGSISISRKGKAPQNFIRLHKGDHLVLTSDQEIINDAVYGSSGELLQFASVSVSLPAIINDAELGHRVFFDDGKIEAKVIKKRPGELEVIIVNAKEKGVKLRSEKGINLPDTKLNLPSLTADDIANMPLVLEHADIVGYSFVRTAEDVEMLYREMDKHQEGDIGVVLKIENQESFENLPMLLLAAMKRPRIGVMIARGDLAVEIGPERIAEVQDQIMWICEAAHVPVVWATQVLENLAKTGQVTRAEITDAAKSARAECVMLNKGPFVIDAVALLSKILKKMEGHTSKKKSVMRALKVSQKNLDRIGRALSKTEK